MIIIETILGIQRRKMTDWGGWRLRIRLSSLEECLDVLDCVIISIEDICVRRSSADEVIGS